MNTLLVFVILSFSFLAGFGQNQSKAAKQTDKELFGKQKFPEVKKPFDSVFLIPPTTEKKLLAIDEQIKKYQSKEWIQEQIQTLYSLEQTMVTTMVETRGDSVEMKRYEPGRLILKPRPKRP